MPGNRQKKVQSEAAEAAVTRTHSKINLVSLHETKEDLIILVFFHVYSAFIPLPDRLFCVLHPINNCTNVDFKASVALGTCLLRVLNCYAVGQ